MHPIDSRCCSMSRPCISRLWPSVKATCTAALGSSSSHARGTQAAAAAAAQFCRSSSRLHGTVHRSWSSASKLRPASSSMHGSVQRQLHTFQPTQPFFLGSSSTSSSTSASSSPVAAAAAANQPSHSEAVAQKPKPALRKPRAAKPTPRTPQAAKPAPKPRGVSVTTSPQLSPEQQAAVAAYLSELSEEQLAAAHSKEQHTRIIAGPGSGKTRVVAARVASLIADGVPPSSLLVITFTRKAAGELLQRLESLLGLQMTRQLRPCTFHALCNSLLRHHKDKLPIGDFQVANEEDVEDTIRAILEKRGSSNASSSSSSSKTCSKASSSSSSSSSKRDVSREVKMYRQAISKIKNFTESIDKRTGAQLIAEMAAAGLPTRSLDGLVAAMYDAYTAQMAAARLVDFDDLLHHCLALIKNNEQVRSSLHGRWAHVLVDESQDTNPCQFELVKALTGPRAHLFMVGDPDQAIYGFRGANALLLSHVFLQHYGSTAATRFLGDNYRSRDPIVTVADMVRSAGRSSTSLMKAGSSKRPTVRPDTVLLLEAQHEYDEADQVLAQLEEWQGQGYAWGDMALLFRTTEQMKFMYRQAIAAGVPAYMSAGKDFWESAEVKTALALLRCVVQPATAGDVLKRRLIRKAGVPVPITAGLGDTAILKLQEHIDANPGSVVSNSSSGSSSSSALQRQQPSLGTCLFNACAPDEMSPQEAAAFLQQLQSAAGSAAAGEGDYLAVLQQLAPEWQRPEGFDGLKTKPQKAVVARLRGLVLLGRAAALVYTPSEVLKLLLNASGVWGELEHEPDKQGLRHLANLKTMVRLAANIPAYTRSPVADLTALDMVSDGDSSSTGPSSSSSAGDRDAVALELLQPTTGLPLLQQFYDYCALMGEGDEDDNKREAVQLLTMHASKGKEFPCVVVMRAYDGSIPYIRRDDDTPDAIGQERNTLYVACTRAKDHLMITWLKQLFRAYKSGDEDSFEVSRFMKNVLRAAQVGNLDGVKVQKRRFIESKTSSSSSFSSSFSSSSLNNWWFK